MQLGLDIDWVIYGYAFVCVTLIVFNLLYIYISGKMKQRIVNQTVWWKEALTEQVKEVERTHMLSYKHVKLLDKKLRSSNELMAYSRALDALRASGVKLQNYLNACYISYQNLAHHYSKKDSMDKAFFASFIAENTPDTGGEFRPITEVMLDYLEDSTVYCRENVFRAMCALGNVAAVINVLEYLEDNGIFHHQKLLSDDLMTFRGDKELLAQELWHNRALWGETTTVAIIQFITAGNGNFQEIFCAYLKEKEISLEIKLAILRYFQKYPYEPVREILYTYMDEEKNSELNLIIVSATVLKHYPGEETVQVLTKALHHVNWYVRYNAASSLAVLTENKESVQEIFEGDDRYAKEILTYMLQGQGKEGGV